MKNRNLNVPFLLLTVLLFISGFAQAAPKDPPYELVTPPQPLNNDAGKLEVVELFWYTCPHCYYFDDHIQTWLKTKPADVDFVRIPAVFGTERGLELAQIFYTAEALGVFDKVHKPIFEALHKDKKTLQSADDFYPIFQSLAGVSQEDFKNTISSFAVDLKVRNAQRLTSKYGISAVPTLIVQGKYRMTSEMTDGYENMFGIVNKLIDQERAAQKLLVAPAVQATTDAVPVAAAEAKPADTAQVSEKSEK